MTDQSHTEATSIIEMLRERLRFAETLLQKGEVPFGALVMFNGAIRFHLEKIYGKDSSLLAEIPPRGTRGLDRTADPRAELARRVEQAQHLIKALEAVPALTRSRLLGNKIFIGHGRSLVWLQLKDFLRERFDLPCDEFNVEPTAGVSTTERLQAMLDQAGLAFVVMTAEEQHADGLVYGRPNVIHESGLFQGKLGTRRAIVMLEEGCSDFSNITGLTQIRFPKGDLRPSFEEVRRVLEREEVI